LRVSLLKEHVKTIEKSMKEIKNLEMMAKPNHNQLIRWVINKEEHCKKIQDIATQYFMFQRVKEIVDINKEKKKMKLLSSLHKICIIAMKMKQQTEMKLTKECLKEITNFEHMYFHKH
jgi:nickel superoxide dismutase